MRSRKNEHARIITGWPTDRPEASNIEDSKYLSFRDIPIEKAARAGPLLPLRAGRAHRAGPGVRVAEGDTEPVVYLAAGTRLLLVGNAAGPVSERTRRPHQLPLR